MREFLINNAQFLVWGLTFLELVLTCLLFIDFKNKREPIVLCMALLGVGLCYDALILGFGGMILTPFLLLLSRLRFVLHGLLLPLSLIICAYAIPLYRKHRYAAWVITGIVMAAGLAAGCYREIGLAEEIGGIVRYVSVSPKDAWMERINTALSFGTVIPLIITGVIVLLRQKSPSILLAGVLMFAFSALGPATGNADLIFLISMFGECFMLLFLALFEKFRVTQ